MNTQNFETAETIHDYTPATQTTAAEVVPEVDFTALLDKSESLDKLGKVLTLTAEYMELEKPGETFRGIFVGFYDMNMTDKTTGEQRVIQGARFLANKQVFVNAGVVLVNELKRGNTAPGTALEILYLRKEGNTKIYQISLLG
jgi:hypothetical protein